MASDERNRGLERVERLGCGAAAFGLVAGMVWAFRRPMYGIPAALLALSVGGTLVRRMSRRERAIQARRTARLQAAAPPAGAAWSRLLAATGLGSHAARIRGRVRHAVRLSARTAEAGAPPGACRLGGAPDLPADLAWPEKDGQPLSFLAQLDLAEVRRVLPESPLPEAGRLWFFYGTDQPWGYDPKHAGGSRVLYREPGAPLVRREPPAGVDDDARFVACDLELTAFEDPPPEIKDGAEPSEEDEEQYLEIREYLASGGGSPSHKVLGHADPVQDEMELQCELVTHGIDCGDSKAYADPRARELEKGAHRWRLLLQVDSDERTGMTWGDAGRVYFWIREEDLKERRFDEVWTILQCT